MKCEPAFLIRIILQVNVSVGQAQCSEPRVSCRGRSLTLLREHVHAIPVLRMHAQLMHMAGKNEQAELFIVLFFAY
ncbi:MAG: hypothetical protein DBY37_03705 [Desulfovibrionaceae bacterium]|nr:MAG: hypothetical protein DBY37_03705 [Desulfovibrionaceae bacterium]